jgi:hypothetical protein
MSEEPPKQKGLIYESKIIEHLETIGCRTQRAESWDRFDKVDFYIVQVAGRRPALPHEFQVTLQIDNLDKMVKYLETRDQARRATKTYVEIEDGVPEGIVAQCLKVVAGNPVREGGAVGGCFGLRIRADRGFHVFSLEETIAQLRERDDPEASASQRLEGLVYECHPSGFNIVVGDNEVYWAYRYNISDTRLIQMLFPDGKPRNPNPGEAIVTFVPMKKTLRSARASSVRLAKR